MKSMTGFGESNGKEGEISIEISLSSVNNKRGLDLHFLLPRELQSCEEAARAIVQQEVARGRINVHAALEARATSKAGLLEVDSQALQHYRKQFETLQRKKLIDREVSPEFLLKLPGVMQDPAHTLDENFDALFEKVLSKAVKHFQAARKREGTALKKDLLEHFSGIEARIAVVKRQRPHVVGQHRKNLIQRLEQSGFPNLIEDERILKEVAIFADRSDVSEEVTRLAAHLEEGRRLAKAKEPVGKSLDFLVQEIGREINTIGSKSNDLKISRAVLEMKAELEKIREQVQNIE